MRSLYTIGFVYIGVSLYALLTKPAPEMTPTTTAVADFGGDAGQWFQAVKPYCNSVEAEMIHKRVPLPDTDEAPGFSAACYALAGKVDRARDVILTVSSGERWKAAGTVFDVAHAIADSGDDESAGPIMELVVEFWPNHWQALYHAGMARYGLGQHRLAQQYLQQFLEYYPEEDGWTQSARQALQQIEKQ